MKPLSLFPLMYYVSLAHFTVSIRLSFLETLLSVDDLPKGKPSFLDTLLSFDFPKGRKLSNVVVDHSSGDVFVAGRNVLYHFSANLAMKQVVATGPVEDADTCLIPPSPCGAERVPTNNENHILKMVYFLGSPPKLLLCGSVYKKLCQIRPTDNLTDVHWVYPHDNSLGYNLGRAKNRALFERGYDGKWTLFTLHAANKDDSSVPRLSKKVLVKENEDYFFKSALQDDPASSYLFIKRKDRRLVRNEGFVHDGFIYFISEHNWIGDSYSTDLFRFCAGDPTFRSYNQLFIRCTHNQKYLVDEPPKAHFGDSSSLGEKSLYLSYATAAGTVLCVFPMANLVEAFEESPKEGTASWLNGNAKPCLMNDTRDNESVCGLKGIPLSCRNLDMKMSVFLPNVSLETLTTVKQHNQIIVVGGTLDGSVIKVSLSTGEIISNNPMLKKKTTFAFPFSLVLDRDNEHIFFLYQSKIIKYPVASCGVHETCTLCLTLGQIDPLQCGWCGGRCTRLEECPAADSFSRDTCNPIIYEIIPNFSAVQVGTILQIIGDSFGSYVDEEHNSVSVASVPCEKSRWNNSVIFCKMGFEPEERSGPIQLNISSNYSSSTGHKYKIKGLAVSSQNFSYYLGPRFYGLRPGKGPTSGGTEVTLFGENLNYDRHEDRMFVVSGRPCTLTELNENTALCITGNLSSLEYAESTFMYFKKRSLFIDTNPPSTYNAVGISQYFEYTRDPKIHQIQPGATTMSGLQNVTCTGIYLNSVQSPKLVVKVTISQNRSDLEIDEECWSDPKSRGTTMTCRTPTLTSVPGVPIPTWTQPLLTHVSFIMDGVQELRDFNVLHEEVSRLMYYPDPDFEEARIDGDETVKIKGNHFNVINLADNFQIRLSGNNSCKRTTITMEYINCDIPLSLIQNSATFGNNISIEVVIGYSRHHLANLMIGEQVQEPADAKEELSPVFLIVFVLITASVIIIAFICFRKWKKKKSLHFFEEVNPDDRTQHLNDYRIVPDHPGESSAVIVQSYSSAPRDESEGNRMTEMQLVDQAIMAILEDKQLIIPKCWLVVGEKVGAGQFGCVFEGILQRPEQTENIKVAIKTLHEHSWSNSQTVESFLKEALIMRDFEHPNVLSLLGVCFEGSVPSILLPYMENGDLCSFIRDETKVLIVTNLLKFAIDIASGMAYLGDKKFLHRDLAARNCILDNTLNVKVADFGLSRDVYVDDYYCCNDRNAMLPYRWMAPESIEKQKYSTKTDVWSYGVLLWELMTRGSIPYAHVDNWDVLEYVKLGHRLDQPEFCPKPIYIVMLACWNQDSKLRPDFLLLQECLSHIRHEILEKKEALSKRVPAKNTVYYNSKDLYLELDGHVLNKDTLEQSIDVNSEYLNMKIVQN